MSNDAWDYFSKDPAYSSVLRERLASGTEMDSAKALSDYLQATCFGDLSIADFGSGPGHYYPVVKARYRNGGVRYLGVDIDAANVAYGNEYFADNPAAALVVGSVLSPATSVPDHVNCVVSANTLPHVPTIEPLLSFIAARTQIRYFIARMLVGSECVQIKKHLKQHDFAHMFEDAFQFNNIYSLEYIQCQFGDGWRVEVAPDIVDNARLEQHRIPAQDTDPFYANRVSRSVGSMVFKGEIYMPWKFVIAARR